MMPPPLSTTSLIAHAAGWTLLHFLWQGVLVALILVCVLALLSTRSAQPRYLAACAALILMAILPAITFTRLIVAERSAAGTLLLFNSVDISATAHGIAIPSRPSLARIATELDRCMPVVLGLWLVGAVLLFLRLGMGLIVARRMMSAATQPPPDDLLRIFHPLADRFAIGKPIRLLRSALVQVPAVIGWLRPVILVPLGCLSGLSPTQIEAILAHELAHIRRHDYLVSVLQSVVEALLFYHPAVWWVSRQIRREREHCCDDLAVHYTHDALTYARALSLLEENRSALPTLAVAANGGILTMRIKRLLESKENAAAPQLFALTLLGLVIAATGICVTTAARAQNNPAGLQQISYNQPAVTAAASIHPVTGKAIAPAYQAWLDQDVLWLISPQERAAFLQLSSDTERDHFIAQFWERRNAPGAAPDSYRVEHYHRIAYTNQHFPAASLAGWQTDRGRVYIVNGAPATVDSHPHSALYNHPYEVWGYGAMQLTFVDYCDCNNYQLLPQSPSGTTSSPALRSPATKKAAVRSISYQPTAAPQPESAPPVKVSGGVMAGQIATRVNPIYPPEAKASRVQGTVVLHAVITKTGEVSSLTVVSGPEELRHSALDAVQQWTYRPYLLNGEPTEVETNININYHLAGPEDSPSSASGITPKKVGGSVSAPVLLHSSPPEYTEQAKQDKVGGVVLVRLWVDQNGRPGHVRVISGIGHGLDEKAVEAVKQYQFTPAMEDGKPVLVELNVEVDFKVF